jgi:hypothetical protein
MRPLGSSVAIILLSLLAQSALAQQRGVVPGEVIVLLEPGTMDLPPDAGRRSLSEVAMTPGRARDVMTRRALRSVRPAVSSWPSFVNAVHDARIRAVRRGVPLAPDELADLSYLYVLEFAPDADVRDISAELTGAPNVVFAEPNYRVFIQASPRGFLVGKPRHARARSAFDLLPNDPLFVSGGNWGSFRELEPEWDVNAPAAWSLQTGRSSVRIAVLEPSGFQTTHTDLAGALVAQYDFDHDDADASQGAPNGFHGTAVAGIALARTNDGFGSAGLCGGFGAGGCSLVYGQIGGASHVADAVTWAVAQGAKVINNSWSVETLSYGAFLAFRNAWIVGSLATAAMGNSEGADYPPAIFSDIVMSVGASDWLGRRVTNPPFTYNSNTGPHISVLAPGVAHGSDSLGNTTAQFDGTSASTPFVSGLAGLMLSEALDLGLQLAPIDVRQIIQQTARQLPGLPAGWNSMSGYGVIDAHRALQVLQPPSTFTTVALGPISTTCHALTPWQWWTFWADFQNYYGQRCEVRRAITFAVPYVTPPMVWGRGVVGGGITPSNPNAQVYYTGVIDGSVTTTGATLKTYAYWLGNAWYPSEPSALSWGYAVLGQVQPYQLTATAPGLVTVKSVQNLTGSANHPSHGWQWERSFNNGPWDYWSNNQNSQFVAYAGTYELGWRLFAERDADGLGQWAYAATRVCIPYNPNTCMMAAPPAVATATAPRLHFGSGVWVGVAGSDGGSATRFYSFGAHHVGDDPQWPNMLEQDRGSWRSPAVAGRPTVRVTSTLHSHSPAARVHRVEGQLFGDSRPRAVSVALAVDPDVGIALRNRLGFEADLGLAWVRGSDSTYVGYAALVLDAREHVRLRQFDRGLGDEPASASAAYELMHERSRFDGGRDTDVRFILTVTNVPVSVTGQFVTHFAVLRARDLGTLRAMADSVGRAPGALAAVPAAAPTTFALRQSQTRAASLSVVGTASDARAVLRHTGIVALEYAVPEGRSVDVRIRIYSPTGQLVRRLVQQRVAAGEYHLEWDRLNDRGERVPPGVYIAVMEAAEFRATRRLVVTR